MPSTLRSNFDRSRQRTCAVSLTVAAVLAAALCAVPTRGLAAVTSRTERVEITLRAAKLPAADRARLADRAQSISDAIASGIPLWRSFEPREHSQSQSSRGITAHWPLAHP